MWISRAKYDNDISEAVHNAKKSAIKEYSEWFNSANRFEYIERQIQALKLETASLQNRIKILEDILNKEVENGGNRSGTT